MKGICGVRRDWDCEICARYVRRINLRGQRNDQESRKWVILFAWTHCVVAVSHLFPMSTRRRATTSCGLDSVDERLSPTPSTPSAALETSGCSIASTTRAAFNISRQSARFESGSETCVVFAAVAPDHHLHRPVGGPLRRT